MVNFPCTRVFTWLYNEPRDIQINTVLNVLMVNALQGFRPMIELEFREDKPNWQNMCITLVYHFFYFVQTANLYFNGENYYKLLNNDHSWYHDNINSWE